MYHEAQLVNASRLSAIGEMAAAITHEINNPLGVILGRAEMIENLASSGRLDEESIKRLVGTILVTGKRIEKIVRSMKTLAHRGNDEEPYVTYSVKEIVSDALELCTQRFRNHGIKLVTPAISDSLMIECHTHEVVQVLVNLLNNAFDAVEGLPEKWAELEVREDGAFVNFSVTDSGKGIPPEVLSKIFEPFFSKKRVQYGTGLGLSISRSIVAQHQGTMGYDAECPNTRFVISLPKKRKAGL